MTVHMTIPQIDKTAPEPPLGSVVLTHSLTGTAWQRHYSDGRWHSTTSHVSDWADLHQASPGHGGAPTRVFLLYTPED